MKEYSKPVILVNEGLSEGVYAASGDECYTINARIHQTPQLGRGDYRIQVDGRHGASDGHHSSEQILTLTFNQPVDYVSSNGSLVSGSGTNEIAIRYTYHNNANDNAGLGDVVVQSELGLSLTHSTLACNYSCGQH